MDESVLLYRKLHQLKNRIKVEARSLNTVNKYENMEMPDQAVYVGMLHNLSGIFCFCIINLPTVSFFNSTYI
jgi:hypothetical protein